MALVKCKDCEKEASESAVACPSCGFKIKSDANPLAAILAFVTVFAGFVWLVNALSGADEEVRPERTQARATVICEALISQKLKSPSSAKFPFGQVVSCDEIRCSSNMVVDSENGLGAMIRSKFSCVVDIADDEWTNWKGFVLPIE